MSNSAIICAILITAIVLIPQSVALANSGWPTYGSGSGSAGSSSLYVPFGGFFFSGFSSDMKFLYSLFALLFLTFYTYVVFTHTSSTYRQQVYEDVYESHSTTKFAKALLATWDMSHDDADSASDGKFAIAESLRMLVYESEWRQRVKDRDAAARVTLLARRVMVLSIHVLLQIGMWVCVILATTFQDQIQNKADEVLGSGFLSSLTSFVPAAVISSASAVMPSLAAIS